MPQGRSSRAIISRHVCVPHTADVGHVPDSSLQLCLNFLVILVWTGTELVFFEVACVGLCFGFMVERVLITKACLLLSSACTASRPFFLTPPHQRVGWGCTRSWEGTQLGQLTPTDQKDVPYHMMSHSAIKTGGRTKKGGMFRVMALRMMKPCFPGDGQMPACQWEVVTELLILLCLHVQLLLCLLNCLYLIPQVFSLLPSQFLPPSHWVREE